MVMSFLKSLAGRQEQGRAEIRPMSDKRHSTYEPLYANMWL
jgi:hypothetical protein